MRHGAGMKYFPLVLAGLWRKPTRTVFTFLSIMVAFVLFENIFEIVVIETENDIPVHLDKAAV